MSREIGFRVWSKKHNTYFELSGTHYEDGKIDGIFAISGILAGVPNVIFLEPEDVVLEQDTGLKDKNGVKIYEGDIVDYTGECTCVVQYEDEGARFIHRDISDDFPFGFNGLGGYNGKLFEVIGNIHENPELLEGEK